MSTYMLKIPKRKGVVYFQVFACYVRVYKAALMNMYKQNPVRLHVWEEEIEVFDMHAW